MSVKLKSPKSGEIFTLDRAFEKFCEICSWYAEGLCANYHSLYWTNSKKPEDNCECWEGRDEDGQDGKGF